MNGKGRVPGRQAEGAVPVPIGAAHTLVGELITREPRHIWLTWADRVGNSGGRVGLAGGPGVGVRRFGLKAVQVGRWAGLGVRRFGLKGGPALGVKRLGSKEVRGWRLEGLGWKVVQGSGLEDLG